VKVRVIREELGNPHRSDHGAVRRTMQVDETAGTRRLMSGLCSRFSFAKIVSVIYALASGFGSQAIDSRRLTDPARGQRGDLIRLMGWKSRQQLARYPIRDLPERPQSAWLRLGDRL
jgi:hypothetical protein